MNINSTIPEALKASPPLQIEVENFLCDVDSLITNN